MLIFYIDDPFIGLTGKWYYVFAEVYIFIGGEIFHRIVKLILETIKKFQVAVTHDKEVEKELKVD